MYVITGITGQVGGTVARTLLAAGKNVRAVVRDTSKGGEWLRQGCELALADMRDAAALTRAFKGAEAVFVLLPPNFDPSPDFLESRYIVSTLRSALETAQPDKVVCLSTIGAQASQSNLLSQLSGMEQQLGQLPMPVAFLRAAWFMENALWDIAPARDEGVLHSFLQPLDKAVPMVATADVGRTAAMLLQESWQGVRIVELEGPRRISPQRLAATLGRLLGRDVHARSVPRDTWEQLFRSQGMHNPLPRMQMLDGFNQGWIDFAGTAIHGTTELETVLADLIQRQA
ncbi:NmrA family NAD(P)-binding protein [Bowmanella yangjiangensis]|uniref:NmrA family NAD(P)-binding protein n=1 Tax=Bowmanella yangjiangensis TaxID=2811230 RepID=A0ABS3CZC1_9ALTE|nr:NmrA family NAD(P)-binding protein [Bowmanella yangjiangensis]MBN7822477.1 NmrA family NAD(P)-binding protein [Bowmanella yangjiangensis]